MNRNELTWNEVRKSLKLTREEEAEIKLEEDIIDAFISAREKNKISQRELSKKSGIKQPAIARMESKTLSPKVSTLLKLLYPMGYTLKVVPLEKEK